LNYDKIKQTGGKQDSYWTAYSDLFTALSVVFLMLFIVASLRSGTQGVVNKSEFAQAQQQIAELKQQVKVYEVLKEDYLKQDASKEDIAVYQQVMSKLSLLEDEAKEKNKELYKQAADAKEKEQQLNQYQELVKSIINANMLSSSKVKKRDIVISEKANVIEQQTREVDDLNQVVRTKQQVIEENSQRVINVQDELTRKIKEVQASYRANKRTKQAMDKEIASLKEQSQSEIETLKGESLRVASQLQSAQGRIEEKSRENERLLNTLSEKEQTFQGTIATMQREHVSASAREKAQFEAGLKQQALSAEARVAKEKAFADQMAQKSAEYNGKLGAMRGELEKTRDGIKDMAGKYQASMAAAGQANDALKKTLADTVDKLNAQKKLGETLAKNLAQAGVDAKVNSQTGEVVINFGGEYFDTGKSDLKGNMRQTLEKLMPSYAKSLFSDPKIAKKISGVEIIGFASPTYKGKYVDPKGMTNEDRAAVNYNMDLSYQRAKSIFEYAFDPNKMQFPYQRELLPKVKVTGRSYLASDKMVGRNVSNAADDYCKQYDCKKAQQVIIKFNLNNE